jgi:hypothetical protein
MRGSVWRYVSRSFGFHCLASLKCLDLTRYVAMVARAALIVESRTSTEHLPLPSIATRQETFSGHCKD